MGTSLSKVFPGRRRAGDYTASDILYVPGGKITASNVQDAIEQVVDLASIIDGEVNTYNDLPPAADHNGEVYLVKTPTGVWPINKQAGLYISNGTTWNAAPIAEGVLTNSDIGTKVAAAGANTDITSVYLSNTGLKIKDTNASHGLSLVPSSDLTADRTLSFATGDASRTITLSGNPTLGDWFNQSVKTNFAPTFLSLNLSDGTAPYILFDSSPNDYLEYVRATNLLALRMQGTTPFSVDMVGVRSQTITGGASTTQVFTLKTTSGIGTSDYLRIIGGNNGTTEFARFSSAGLTLPLQTASTLIALDISKNVISLDPVTYPSFTEISYVKGVTSAIQTQIDSKQAADADLTAIAAISGTGILARTASDTWAVRTITGTSNQITVTNGDGVGGAPTLALPQDIHSGATPTFAGLNLSATNPRITFDSTDYLQYNRSNNEFAFYVADSIQTSIRPSGLFAFAGVVGGALSGSVLTLKSTSANGSGDYISMVGGNNGATEIARFSSSAINLPLLTASQVVVTNGSKNLASLAYSDTTPTNSALVQRSNIGRIYATGLILDSQFSVDFTAGNPAVFFDASDFLLYNRTTNQYDFLVGGTSYATISSGGIVTNLLSVGARPASSPNFNSTITSAYRAGGGINTTSGADKTCVWTVSNGSYTTSTKYWDIGIGSDGGTNGLGFIDGEFNLFNGSVVPLYIKKTGETIFRYAVDVAPLSGSAQANIRTAGTAGTDQVSFFIGTKDLVGNAAGRGWVMFGRGNAWATPADANILGWSYWNGSTYTQSLRMNTNGSLQFSSYGAGTLVTDASGNVTASSDESLKTNIQPYSRGYSDIIKISPISFKWDVKSGLDYANTYYGFSANNLFDVMPEATGMDSRGYRTISDRPILAAMVNSFRNLNSIVSGLDCVSTINSSIASIQAKIQARSFKKPTFAEITTSATLSSTRDASVVYCIDAATTITILGGQVVTAILTYADNEAMTVNPVIVSSSSTNNTGLAGLSQINTLVLSGVIPAGKYRKVTFVVSGGAVAPTQAAYKAGQEVLI